MTGPINRPTCTGRSIVRALLIAAALGVPAIIASRGLLINESNAEPRARRHEITADTITLNGLFRDFKGGKTGHPDFDVQPPDGRAIYTGIMGDFLNEDGDPVPVSLGAKVTTQGRDASNRPIIGPKDYIESKPGDIAPVATSGGRGAVKSLASAAQWFTDVNNVNMSASFPMVLRNDGQYWTFDADLETQYAHVSGFGGNKVYGYTYEVETSFVYEASRGDVFIVGADDCLWVYINGMLVADLGGNHDYMEQTIDLNRLGLVDGASCQMKLFYAERAKGGSRLKFQTTATNRSVGIPPITTPYD